MILICFNRIPIKMNPKLITEIKELNLKIKACKVAIDERSHAQTELATRHELESAYHLKTALNSVKNYIKNYDRLIVERNMVAYNRYDELCQRHLEIIKENLSGNPHLLISEYK